MKNKGTPDSQKFKKKKKKKKKHLLTHVNRIKPYLVPTRSDVHFEDEKIQSKNDEKQEKLQENVEKE